MYSYTREGIMKTDSYFLQPVVRKINHYLARIFMLTFHNAVGVGRLLPRRQQYRDGRAFPFHTTYDDLTAV